MNENQTLGTYRVTFTLGDTGHYRYLQSSKIVQAESREAAVASVDGGVDAEVIEWAPGEREAFLARSENAWLLPKK